MNNSIGQTAVGALVFAAVWIIISLLFFTDISWMVGVAGAIAFFAAAIALGQVERRG